MVSALIARGDSLEEERIRANLILQELCHEEDVPFIDHGETGADKHLNGSEHHLNRFGDGILAREFLFAS